MGSILIPWMDILDTCVGLLFSNKAFLGEGNFNITLDGSKYIGLIRDKLESRYQQKQELVLLQLFSATLLIQPIKYTYLCWHGLW